MSSADKETFAQAKPFVVGIIALLFQLARPAWTNQQAFGAAEQFVKEFEGRV